MNLKDIFNKCKEKDVEIRFSYSPSFNCFRVTVISQDISKRKWIGERAFDFSFLLDEAIDNYIGEEIDFLIDDVVRISQK